MNQQKRSTNRFSKPLLMANGEHLISVVPPAAQITPKLSLTIFDKSSLIFFLSEKTQTKGEKRTHFFILKTWNTHPVTETLRFPIETVLLCTKNLTKKNSQESDPKSLLKTSEVHNFLTRTLQESCQPYLQAARRFNHSAMEIYLCAAVHMKDIWKD